MGCGNLQSVDADLAAEITKLWIQEIKETKASIVVSACQQCEQMLCKLPFARLVCPASYGYRELLLEAIG